MTAPEYNYFRDYDPAVGRYVESDPIGLEGGINTYAYADSHPVSKADSLGLVPGAGPRSLPPTIRRTCNEADKQYCAQKCGGLWKVRGCYVTLKFRLAGVRGGNRIGGYEVQSVECNCEDDGICSSNDGKAACILAGIVVGVGLCAAPEVTIPALIISGTATAPAR